MPALAGVIPARSWRVVIFSSAIPVPFLVFDYKCLVVFANLEVCRLFGYAAEDLQGMNVDGLVPASLSFCRSARHVQKIHE